MNALHLPEVKDPEPVPCWNFWTLWKNSASASARAGSGVCPRSTPGPRSACAAGPYPPHGCQMAKFDPFLSLDCARVEGVGAQSKERKGSNFAA